MNQSSQDFVGEGFRGHEIAVIEPRCFVLN